MLTKDLLRYRIRSDKIEAFYLKDNAAQREHVSRLLQRWASLAGQSRTMVADMMQSALYQYPNLQTAKGVQRVLEQASGWEEPSDVLEQRWEILAESVKVLQNRPAADAQEHRERVVMTLPHISEDADDIAELLYSDHPDAAVLKPCKYASPEQVIRHYNIGLIQGLLLHTEELVIRLQDPDAGIIRMLANGLRFQRLLAELKQTAAGIEIRVSGPASVVDQQQRYGMQLALFFPILVHAKDWELEARCRPPKREQRHAVSYHLDSSQLPHLPRKASGFIPEEAQSLPAILEEHVPDWQQLELSAHSLANGKLLVPDVSVRHEEKTLHIELFHRWHRRQLDERIAQIKSGEIENWMIGVDRQLLKSKKYASLSSEDIEALGGFCYSSFPGAQILKRALKKHL